MNTRRVKLSIEDIPSKKKSPYLSMGNILTAVVSSLMIASFAMFFLTAVFLILTVAFIILKVTALVTFGWGWVFSPIWIPIGVVFSLGIGSFIGCYLLNAYIFIKRLCTGKIGK